MAPIAPNRPPGLQDIPHALTGANTRHPIPPSHHVPFIRSRFTRTTVVTFSFQLDLLAQNNQGS